MKMRVVLGVLLCLTLAQAQDWFGGDTEETASSATRPNIACNHMDQLPNTCQNFAHANLNGINEQIKRELNASYTYMAMASYFGRADMAYRGAAKFFLKASDEEREHAMKFVEYLNKRGGKPHFKRINQPDMEWGTYKNAFEKALLLEKEVNENLLALHWEAQQKNDPHLQDFIESEFLTEQVDSIKQLSDFVSVLRRPGANPIVWYMFDEELYEGKR